MRSRHAPLRQTEAVVRSLDAVKAAVDRLAEIIQPPDDLLPTYGVSRDFGYAHIEIDGILMSYGNRGARARDRATFQH